MSMKKIDYNNYDRLDVYAKKEKTDKIIKCYECFSWCLICNEDNKRYADTCDLTFIREHRIANKDFLQYRQIEMENVLNKIGKLEKNKHSKTTVVGLCLGLLSACFVAGGVFLLYKYLFVLGILLLVLSVFFCLFTIYFTIKTYRYEMELFEEENKSLNDLLTSICKSVKKETR